MERKKVTAPDVSTAHPRSDACAGSEWDLPISSHRPEAVAPKMRRCNALATGAVLLGVAGIAIVAALSANVCNAIAGGIAPPSEFAVRAIPSRLLAIYEEVGSQFGIPWEVLAGIATEECSQARTPDPSCSLQPEATGAGVANYVGASGLMQIGIGGGAGDEYDRLRQYLPNPALGPHDPLTAATLVALVLIKDEGPPQTSRSTPTSHTRAPTTAQDPQRTHMPPG
jgi:hypothetical protein